MDILWLDQNDVKSLITLSSVMATVEQAFEQHGKKKVQMPSKSYLYFNEYNGDLRTMPAYLEEQDISGVKVVNVHPDNRSKGLPSVMALVVLNSTETGQPLAIMDGTYLTDLRTGAAGGVAAKYLARKDSHKVGIIGAGNQAKTQLSALSLVFDIHHVNVYDVSKDRCNEFKKEMEVSINADIVVVPSVEDACDCDILVTVTPTRDPIVKAEWVKSGTHINAIGADAAGKEELDPSLLKSAKIIVDDIIQASHSGEVNIPLSNGSIVADDIWAEIGDIVAGFKEGRVDDMEITIFDSTGLAIQDIATADLVYNAAKVKDIGRSLQLF